MPRCPTCRKYLSAGRDEIGTRCPNCREPLYERPFDDEWRLARAGDNLCAVHPANAAVGTCRRCGNFACDVCWTRWRDKMWCAACVDRALETHEASPEDERTHLRQSLLGLGFGLASWIVCLLAFVIMAVGFAGGEGDKVNVAVVGFGVIALMGCPIFSVLGVGQAAAAIRTRGDHMILATAGLIVSGINVAVIVGLFGLAVWQE